jgi:hypothetical protein
LKSKRLCLISIESKNFINMKSIEQILDNFQEAFFVKDLKQHFYNKNDNNVCDLDESKSLIYYKVFYYASPRPTQYMSFKHVMTFHLPWQMLFTWLSKKKNCIAFTCHGLVDYQQLRPFLIIGQINTIAFGLQLSRLIKIHSIFYVLVFEPFHKPIVFGRHIWPPPLLEIDVENLFEVKKIIDSWISCRYLEY